MNEILLPAKKASSDIIISYPYYFTHRSRYIKLLSKYKSITVCLAKNETSIEHYELEHIAVFGFNMLRADYDNCKVISEQAFMLAYTETMEHLQNTLNEYNDNK